MKRRVNFCVVLICILSGSSVLASEYKRLYPKAGRRDTMVGGPSEQPMTKCFEDHEIVKVHRSIHQRPAKPPKIYRSLFQQPSLHGCTIGVTKMLLADHNKDYSYLAQHRKFGSLELIFDDLEASDLKPKMLEFSNSFDNLVIDDLKQALSMTPLNGSIVLHIFDEHIGQHVIIVDKIIDVKSRSNRSERSKIRTYVRLRDPYHGWEVSVKAEALLKRIERLEYIYLENASFGPSLNTGA